MRRGEYDEYNELLRGENRLNMLGCDKIKNKMKYAH